jgi:hypothetical protein
MAMTNGQAHGNRRLAHPTEQIAGTSVDCYSSKAFGSEAPRPRSLRPPNRSECVAAAGALTAHWPPCRWVSDGQPGVTLKTIGRPERVVQDERQAVAQPTDFAR